MSISLPPTTSMIRNVLLFTYTLVWSIATILPVVHGEKVSPEQWTALPMGVGAILFALRPGRKDDRDDPEDS